MTPAAGLKGGHVLAIFLAFFLTVTGVNALMVTFAISSFSGEDVSSAYVKGLNYNAALAQHDAEGRSGFAVVAHAERASDGTTRIDAEVTQNGAFPQSDIAVTATLRHPANAHLDRTVPLALNGQGAFTAVVPDLNAGQWDLVIAVQRGGDTLYEARSRAWLR